MREVQVPSYRVRDVAEDGGSRRMMLLAGGFAGLLAVGGIAGWAFSRYSDTTVPVVQADARPIKIRPDDRGGLRVANQDEIIFERRTASGVFEPAGRLGPAAEAPNLDALRAATAPPPGASTPPSVSTPVEPSPVAEAAPSVAAVTAEAQAPAAAQPAPPAVQAAPVTPPVVATPTPPAPPKPAAPAATGSVVVQLGALDSESGARSEWERLRGRAPSLLQGRSPQVIRFEREGKPTMWRLRTGGFENRSAAGSFCESIRSQGGACAVIGG